MSALSPAEIYEASHSLDQVAAEVGRLTSIDYSNFPSQGRTASFGIRCIETAQLLAEYQLRDGITVPEQLIAETLFQRGMVNIERSVSYNYRRRIYTQKYLNSLVCLPVYRWLCSERLDDSPLDFDRLANRQLRSVTRDVRKRHKYISEEADRIQNGSPEGPDRLDQLGFVFEAMVIGMVAKDEKFRKARILATPAPQELEHQTKSNPKPIDVALWEIQTDKTARLVGGFDCKGVKTTGRGELDDFGIRLIVRPNFSAAGSSLREIIHTWLDQEEPAAFHEVLHRRISSSKNVKLMAALGIEPQVSQQAG